MEVDGAATRSSIPNRKKVNRSKLKRKTKLKNSITFPKSRGKGALKPFSDSRVRKRR